MPPSRILVIDDNEADISLFRAVLDPQAKNYEFEILRDGEEALGFILEHRIGVRTLDPCVILLDLHLPRHDGLAILRAIREAPGLEHIQVMVLSGVASPHQEAEIADLGAVYRTKPSTLNELDELAAEITDMCKNSSIAIFR